MARKFKAPHARSSFFALDTWIEPEELCYPRGGYSRRARAIRDTDGAAIVVTIGIPDTFFSVPVKGGGFVCMTDGHVEYVTPKS